MQITKGDVVAVHQRRRAEGAAPASANRLLVRYAHLSQETLLEAVNAGVEAVGVFAATEAVGVESADAGVAARSRRSTMTNPIILPTHRRSFGRQSKRGEPGNLPQSW